MKFKLEFVNEGPASIKADVLAVVVPEGALADNAAVRDLDRALGGELLALCDKAEFKGKRDQVLDVPALGKISARRILLVGTGSAESSDAPVRDAVAVAVRAALAVKATSVALSVPDRGPSARALGEGVVLGQYRFTKYLTGERRPKSELSKVFLLSGKKASAAQNKELALGTQVAAAICLARDAVNEPPNELYPEELARRAQKVAKRHGFAVKVLDKRGILQQKMLLHYAVGQGSAHEPRFIHMTYKPARKAKQRLVFVGKGLTFDSGGLCIKPAPGMGEMKSDMAGAAAVLGLMAAVGALRPAAEVHGIIAAAENMPDGAAYRPGDVFGSLGGKTVEIINTDAEGRLVLADALTYAARLKPDLLVDAATLTGACLVALGKTCSGYYATSDALAARLEAAAKEAGESFWRLPLLDDLAEELKSDVADLKHTGERWGGSITAALFLREFTESLPWVHCDIAGPVLSDRPRGAYPKGGTGHAVLTFLRLVENA
ncbi:MAG TPA: leucyl aminopeptidase [Polyangiaceae bacterium]|jgi:leucyl aminopeptidase